MPDPLRRTLAALFAGDRRVWRAAALCAVPFLLVMAYEGLRPRLYYTGTDNVEALSYVAQAPAGSRLCVPGLQVPAGTARVRLLLLSRTQQRPVVQAELTISGHRFASTVPGAVVPGRISAVEVAIPRTPSRPATQPATLCASAAGDVVNWGGTPLPAAPANPPSLAGKPLAGRIAVWYLPPAGSERSYLARFGEIVSRAALFRPGIVGAWLYVLLLVLVLPGLALAAVRALAVAVAGRGAGRGTMLAIFAIAAVNFFAWALITPPFQAPDEVDHFAYTQSLVERGDAPSDNPGSPLARWSSSEALALEDSAFFTDHQIGNSHPPWLSTQQRAYEADVARLHPSHADGGGNETAATHGPIYYAALAPGYLAGGSSPWSELTLMRLLSALLGALVPVFAYLIARELAPGRPWIAVLAALLVVFEPMYGFISGAVNNDVGVNAGAAALELLTIRTLRRGITWPAAIAIGLLLALLPQVKGTIISLYPVVALGLLATIWRHHRRSTPVRLGVVGVAVLVGRLLGSALASAFSGTQGGGAGAAPSSSDATSAALNSGSAALEHPVGYLSYLWQVFLPKLPGMARHFEDVGWPAYTIFVKRGWGAFGWYDVLFQPWVYKVILVAMVAVAVLAVLALRLERRFVRAHLLELALLVLMPLAVVAGFEAAFYTPGSRNFIPEFGRYAFPAIAPLAVLVVAALHGLGRRLVLYGGVALLVAMLSLSVASQLLTLSIFYA
ncbi:MAG TPA: phospholipid carrier-dependent glycosyltransferase [Solirubrobacteraceae bacterium]|nr:phospholipid carrier-dependent glycosyltransferase [Solirubrobacteraceae bacterium]